MFYDEVMQAAGLIRDRIPCRPDTAVVLGSGLGPLAGALENPLYLPYAEVPGFPKSDVSGHAARFVFGSCRGREIVAMQGRFHYYEGIPMRRLCFPVYVLRQLGVRTLILTNACGGINPALAPGDLMLVTDHLNLTGCNPLIGENDERLTPRFPDMTEVYDRGLCSLAREAAAAVSVPLREGVYAFFSGPCYETAAEIRAYRALGADAVGMSTVPEATAAHAMGMKVLAVSCITNMATGISPVPHAHSAVLAAAEAAGDAFGRLLMQILTRLPA